MIGVWSLHPTRHHRGGVRSQTPSALSHGAGRVVTSLPLTQVSHHTGAPTLQPDSMDSEEYDDIGAA